MDSFTKWIIRHSSLMLFGSLFVTVFAVIFSVKIFNNLRLDLEELLPSRARSVLDLSEIRRRLKPTDSLAVLIYSKNIEASRRFVENLAARLKASQARLADPETIIGNIEYKMGRELRFFRDRRVFYLDLEDLKEVRRYVRDSIEYQRDLHNPLTIFSNTELEEPRLETHKLLKKYESKVTSYSRFPDGYFATPDETKRVLLVYPARSSNRNSDLLLLKRTVENAVSGLGPVSYSSDLRVKYSGNVENSIEEQAAIFQDIRMSTLVVVFLVSAALFLFFRSGRATFALLTSLFMGTAWTFGISYFLVGSLNANSAFLGSIVIGNGINFGIILTARYLEELKKGREQTWALRIAMDQSASATLTAALGAGLSYGSLMLTGFRGFRQFGVIGLVGMVCCWISAYTVLPALLVRVRAKKGVSNTAAFNFVAQGVQRWPRGILGVSVILTLLSAFAWTRFSPDVLEADLTKIRSRATFQSGSAFYQKDVDEIFKRYLSPVVILPRDASVAPRVAEHLRQVQKAQGPSSLIASVQTLEDFLPRQQEEKLRVLSDIRTLLPKRIVSRLSAKDQRLARELLSNSEPKPFGPQDLPPLVLNRFTEKDGSFGKLVLVEPPLGGRIHERENLFSFVRELRKAADTLAPGTPVAGTLPLTADILESVAHDGPQATFFAFFAVVLLVMVMFRRPRFIGYSLTALLLGVLWMTGVILGMGWKVNFLNFIAFPITFGIGIDYGVNVFQRYLLERASGHGGIAEAVRNTGAAVALCSLTTIIGYGSLLFAQNQAFFSFGLLAVVGEVTCLTAAIFALPAWIVLADRQRQGRRALSLPAATERRAA